MEESINARNQINFTSYQNILEYFYDYLNTNVQWQYHHARNLSPIPSHGSEENNTTERDSTPDSPRSDRDDRRIMFVIVNSGNLPKVSNSISGHRAVKTTRRGSSSFDSEYEPKAFSSEQWLEILEDTDYLNRVINGCDYKWYVKRGNVRRIFDDEPKKSDCTVLTDVVTMAEIAKGRLRVMTAMLTSRFNLLGDRDAFKQLGKAFKLTIQQISDEYKQSVMLDVSIDDTKEDYDQNGKPFIIYQLHCRNTLTGDNWKVHHRFSDFVLLKKKLASMGYDLPPFPSRMLSRTASASKHVIEYRANQLTLFLRRSMKLVGRTNPILCKFIKLDSYLNSNPTRSLSGGEEKSSHYSKFNSSNSNISSEKRANQLAIQRARLHVFQTINDEMVNEFKVPTIWENLMKYRSQLAELKVESAISSPFASLFVSVGPRLGIWLLQSYILLYILLPNSSLLASADISSNVGSLTVSILSLLLAVVICALGDPVGIPISVYWTMTHKMGDRFYLHLGVLSSIIAASFSVRLLFPVLIKRTERLFRVYIFVLVLISSYTIMEIFLSLCRSLLSLVDRTKNRNVMISTWQTKCYQWLDKVVAQFALKEIRLLGSVIAKFAEYLASRPDLISQPWACELSSILVDCPKTSYEDVKRIVQQDLGKPIEEIFESFDVTPFTSGCLYQMHYATIKRKNFTSTAGSVVEDGGEDEDLNNVIVKIQHPEASFLVLDDLSAIITISNFISAYLDNKWRPLDDMLKSWNAALRDELDFSLEINNIQETAQHMSEAGYAVEIPFPYPEMSSKRLLVMSRLNGFPICDHNALTLCNVNRSLLIRQLAHAFAYQFLVAGFFVADIHGGNIFSCRRGVLGSGGVDSKTEGNILFLEESENGPPKIEWSVTFAELGMTIRLSDAQRQSYCRLILALENCDIAAGQTALQELGLDDSNEKFEHFEYLFRDATNLIESKYERQTYASWKSKQLQSHGEQTKTSTNSVTQNGVVANDDENALPFILKAVGAIRGLSYQLGVSCQFLTIFALNAKIGLNQLNEQ